VGAFEEFNTRRQDLEHAYMKLTGVDGKPQFDKVYSYLTEFIKPFVKKDNILKIWNSEKSVWCDYAERKPSLLDRVKKHDKESVNRKPCEKSKNKDKSETI